MYPLHQSTDKQQNPSRMMARAFCGGQPSCQATNPEFGLRTHACTSKDSKEQRASVFLFL